MSKGLAFLAVLFGAAASASIERVGLSPNVNTTGDFPTDFYGVDVSAPVSGANIMSVCG